MVGGMVANSGGGVIDISGENESGGGDIGVVRGRCNPYNPLHTPGK